MASTSPIRIRPGKTPASRSGSRASAIIQSWALALRSSQGRLAKVTLIRSPLDTVLGHLARLRLDILVIVRRSIGTTTQDLVDDADVQLSGQQRVEHMLTVALVYDLRLDHVEHLGQHGD